MEKQLKEKIRSVIRENFIKELSKNDVHVKEIMKFYDKGTYSTKKAVSIFVSGKPNATRNQILDDLGDMGYNDVWEVMDHFKLKIESVNEASMPPVRKVVNAILKKYGVVPMKTTSTSVRGFHNIQRGGYRYEGNYFLGFYGVPQDIIDKVGAEMEKAGVKGVDVRKGIISADFTKTGLKESVNEADVVPGGLAKGLSLNDIAEKHGVSVDMMVAEFKKGIAVEMEHTTDREVAKEITLDHLFEDPKYYDKLAKVEEYIDKKGVERVAAALPQTEEEPVNESNDCGCK
jgi:hypothetical protein